MAILATKKDTQIALFLRELMRRRKRRPSQLAKDLGISHATVRRWLFGEDIPSVSSCQLLADYSGIPIQKVLKITGQLPEMSNKEAHDWPEFREYAHKKYPTELDEDLIIMIEDHIERRRERKYNRKKQLIYA